MMKAGLLALWQTCPASFLGSPAGEMRLAQIELPLDPAPRLVFELAAAKQLVDVVSLRGDQLELDFLVNLGEPSVALVTIAAVLDVLEPLAVTGTERANEPLRQAAFRPELFEPFDRCFDRLAPGVVLLDPVGAALAAAGVGKAERADHGRQHQALTHQRHQND